MLRAVQTRFSSSAPGVAAFSEADKDRGADASTSMLVSWLVRVAKQYWWIPVLASALATTTGYFYTQRQPRVYQASARIEYNPAPASPLGRSVEDVANPVSNYWLAIRYFETQNLILTSRGLLERVARRLGLEEESRFSAGNASPELSPVERAALSLQRKISVHPIENTQLVEIRATDTDPAFAADIANAVCDEYLAKTVEDHMSATVDAIDWLSDQLNDVRSRLIESEQALHNFKKDNAIVSVSMEDRQNLVASDMTRFGDELATVRARRVTLEARVEQLRGLTNPKALAAFLGGEDGNLGRIATELSDLEAKRGRLETRFGPNHPTLVELNQDIESTSAELRRAHESLVTAHEAQLAQVYAMEKGFRAALAEANQRGLDLNRKSMEFERLQRTQVNNENLYQMLLKRSTETDLTRMVNFSHVRVVDRALQPQRHIFPRLSVNLAAFFAIGLLLGVGLALLLGRLDHTLRTVEELKDLGVSVIGVTPRALAEQSGLIALPQTRRSRRRAERSPNEPASVASRTRRDLLVHHHAGAAAAEAIRSLRTALLFASIDRPLRTLVVTSPKPGEGKTTLAVNLAVAFAQSTKKVLLVDADLRRPRIHQTFGVDNSIGLTNLIAGVGQLEDALLATDIPGLALLTSGPLPPTPSEMLHAPGFSQTLAELKARFDLIIFDTPPVVPVTDASVLAAEMDGTLLVVRSKVSTRDALLSALDSLGRVRARLLGVALNEAESPAGRYGKGYGYGYGYGYTTSEEPSRPDAGDSSLAPKEGQDLRRFG